MGRAQVLHTLAGSVQQAQACWYDTARWPVWVDGLERVLEVDGDWPGVGSTVTWESGPAGRGRVIEQVIAYDAARGQTLAVDDASIGGLQSVSFAPAPDGVQLCLSLEYRLKRRSIVSPLVDLLFIRRAIGVSLGATVARFGVELAPEPLDFAGRSAGRRSRQTDTTEREAHVRLQSRRGRRRHDGRGDSAHDR